MSKKTHLVKTLLDEKFFQNGGLFQRENKISPVYVGCSPGDDIYNKHKEMKDTIPEDISSKKVLNEVNDFPKEIDLFNNGDRHGLDVTGAQLNNADEMIGEEDEVDNYYSITGDNYKELEEDHYD